MEIFEKVVNNDPYGEYADKAQFKIGECYNKDGRFGEAVMAFQKLIEEYPKSGLLDEAKYQVAYSTYRASMDHAYNQDMTDDAIEEFEEFARKGRARSLVADAGKVLDKLRERKARSIFDVAHFYERQHRYTSAAVYYREITEKYSDTSLAAQALSKYTELEKKVRGVEQKAALRKAYKSRIER